MAADRAGPDRSVGDGEKGGKASDERIEAAKRNIVFTVILGGTCIAIFTFMMFFLYPRLAAGAVEPIRFRLSVGGILLTLFFFVYAGSHYFAFLQSAGRNDERAAVLLRRANRYAVTALMLLFLAPALVLFATDLPDLGSLAVALWLAYAWFVFVGLRPSGAEAHRRAGTR